MLASVVEEWCCLDSQGANEEQRRKRERERASIGTYFHSYSFPLDPVAVSLVYYGEERRRARMLRQALLALAQSNAGGSSVKRQGGRCLEYAAAWAWAAEWPRKGRRFSTTTKANQEARRKTAVTNPSSVVRQYKPLPEGWETIIGVEVHAQLKSKRKLFSSARTPVTSAGEDTAGGDQADNTLVAYYDASLPGSLPTMQEEALLLAMRACLALDCAVGDVVTFDRKHYLYADLPGGFQVTQKYGAC